MVNKENAGIKYDVPVSVMIFTLNEEQHLPACLASLSWCDEIIVVDSYSNDRTLEIARESGAQVHQHAFMGFGDQRNWAIKNITTRHAWILILDADERVTPGLVNELSSRLPNLNERVSAFRVRRRFYMWGRWLKYSSLYPSWVVRLVRKGSVEFVNRGHAETQVVDGETHDLQNDLLDENIKGIDEWFDRQNRYSSHEAKYELLLQYETINYSNLFDKDPLVRRTTLKQISVRLPARPFLYFIYSYIFRGGFLDGSDGFVFCMMRSIYQGMIVAKKHDMQKPSH